MTCSAFISQTTHVPVSEDSTGVSFDGLLPYTAYNCCVSMETTKANSSAACQDGITLEEGSYRLNVKLALAGLIYKGAVVFIVSQLQSNSLLYTKSTSS